MTDFTELLKACRTPVIFRELMQDMVLADFLGTLEALCRNDKADAAERYCRFISGLYEHGDDLTFYMQKLVLENENLYIIKRAEGRPTGELLDECLANELYLLEQIASIPCDELLDNMDYDGFMPRYRTTKLDFSKTYADRIHGLNKYGYGIFAQYHVFVCDRGKLVPVNYPDDIRLSDFSGYERERREVIDNTLALIAGKPANNVLLYGDCGTGKSSTVKAIANEYAKDGLRLIELKKKQLHELPDIVKQISRNPLKFIIFIDDLSFTEDDDDFAALKAILEGSVSSSANNLCIYATSNRRHLIRETFSARKGDEIHFKDTMQELVSLSDRFGLTVTFTKPDKTQFLSVVEDLAERYEISTPIEEVRRQAEAFALTRAGRSPRVAKQFIEYLKGSEE